MVRGKDEKNCRSHELFPNAEKEKSVIAPFLHGVERGADDH
jgi:hypothetical protein